MFKGKLIAGAVALTLCGAYAQAALASANASDANMRYASQYIERVADQLQTDRNDYGGHRVAAIADINQARADIAAGLAYDNGHPHANPQVSTVNDADEAAFVQGQEASNHDLTYDRRYIERAIDMLQHDAPDYNGYRLKAIAALQAAHQEIVNGLSTYHQAAGAQSDSNIRYTRGYIARGIAMLNQDQHDYAGHRIAAINALQAADADLLAAIRADNSDESIPTVAALPAPADLLRNQQASNANIRYARAYVEHATDMLQNDQHDYNGYRAKAVSELGIAHQQLLEAIASR